MHSKLLITYFLSLVFFSLLKISAQSPAVPLYDSLKDRLCTVDWLITQHKEKAGIYMSAGGRDIILNNGLVKRTFRLSPNVVCTEYKNMSTGQQLLRAVMPEAVVTINKKEYNVGGLYGQKEKAYLLPEWLDMF